jgi:hypothetical protein
MGGHYALDSCCLPGALAHGWIPMSSGHLPGTNITGLWLATYAHGLLFLQLLIGLSVDGWTAGILSHGSNSGASGWALRPT